MALLGGLAQPVLGRRLVTALAVVPAERVRGRGGTGDGRDAPPAGGLLGIAPLMQEDSQVVGRGPVTGGRGGTQMGLGSVEITAAQQHAAEDAHRLDVAGLCGRAPACLLGQLLGDLRGFVLSGNLGNLGSHKSPPKPPRLEQSCLVPHNVHRRTTCNPGTPGIPQPVRSLQRFVDMPTERQVKHRAPNSPARQGCRAGRHMRSQVSEERKRTHRKVVLRRSWMTTAMDDDCGGCAGPRTCRGRLAPRTEGHTHEGPDP